MNIKNLITYFKSFTDNHPILRTFSWGNLSDYSREDYITQYPAIHFVPQPSTIGNNSQDITFSVLIYDLLNEWVGNPINSNQLDSIALCEEIMGDFVNNFINQLTQYGYFLNMPISYTYFVDRFAESVCGVEAQITITIEQTACIPPLPPEPCSATTEYNMWIDFWDNNLLELSITKLDWSSAVSPSNLNVNLTLDLVNGTSVNHTLTFGEGASYVLVNYRNDITGGIVASGIL